MVKAFNLADWFGQSGVGVPVVPWGGLGADSPAVDAAQAFHGYNARLDRDKPD
ncbi:hypothetical protein SAMN04490190_1170 [Pseudomonas libanensis]|uniref:hypothetical protein n=1 Tax=Pseudomonas libanensis TaxID=75588 RepID=UPI00087BFBDD|nr:hypothetical protein [Pseudomonas libanensis]SDK70288.1 hypothetical protein SAMN04490190_1170 [Pseudomonas libanensis]